MIDSMLSNQATSGTFSSSLEDLTSLSSISSGLTSLEPISSNQSTISSCNKSLLDEDKCNDKCDYMSSNSETLASPSFFINRELRKRLAMFSSDLDEPDSKSDSIDSLSGNLSDMSEPSYDDNSSQNGMVKELHKNTTVHKTHDYLDGTDLNDFEDLEGNDSEFSTDSTLKSNLLSEAFDNSSISVADDDPASIQQFKDMVKKQKIYLDSLQRELLRLQRMEQVLSKLHKKSKMQKEMLKKIEICDNCEGICNYSCQLPSNSGKILDADSKSKNLNQNNHPLKKCESSNENTVEKEQCANFNSFGKLKSDATTQTKPSGDIRENNIIYFPTKKERIHQIHDKVDQIIHKLHEATTMDPDAPCHSVGIQTSNSLAPSQKGNRKLNKSACNFASSSTLDKSQKRSVFWTIPATEHKTEKFYNFRSNYQTTEDSLPKATNLSLQQAFRERCSHVLKNSESRVNRINIKSELRKANTNCSFEEQLDFMYKRDQDVIGYNGPDKVRVIKPRKIFTEKEMRRQTERLYSHLPEVKKIKEEKMKQQNGKTNRLMAKIFSQRLKSNAVHGKVTFPLTQKLTQI